MMCAKAGTRRCLLHSCSAERWFSKRGARSSDSITWQCGRDIRSQVPPQTYRTGHAGSGTGDLCFNKLSR